MGAVGVTVDTLMGAREFAEAGTILLDGVLNPLGGEPVAMSHSEAMGVAVRTLVRRGIWVLIRLRSILELICATPLHHSCSSRFTSLRRNHHIICPFLQSNDLGLSGFLDNPLLFDKVATSTPPKYD